MYLSPYRQSGPFSRNGPHIAALALYSIRVISVRQRLTRRSIVCTAAWGTVWQVLASPAGRPT